MLPEVKTLRKDSLEATYEYVNRLVKEESGENFDNVKEFTEYNNKLNVFEKKVQGIIVDSLRIKEGVISGLLSDDLHVIRRALKCDWFFEDAVSPEFYENSIFPYVSFSTRCKIITKLSKNIKSEKHAEKLFQFINHNYGTRYAEMFLPRCSSEFISAYMTECKPLFHHNTSVKVLINVCKRFPKIVILFLEKVFCADYQYKSARNKYTKLILFIAKTYPEEFIPFFEKNYLELTHIRFGKKLAKTFSIQLKNVMMKSFSQYSFGMADEGVIFKCLTFDDQVDYLGGLVRAKKKELTFENWSQALYKIVPLLSLKSPIERVRLLEASFSKIYNEKLIHHPELWTYNFLDLLPLEYRSQFVDILLNMPEKKIMELKLYQECKDPDREIRDTFLYLMNCKVAYPRFTELMTKISTTLRRELLLKEMIQNCIVNNDSEGLQVVLNYILKRHKNDDPRMLMRIMHVLRSVPSKMLNLNIWDLMEQMVTLVLLNAKEYSTYKSVIEKYMRFRLKNKLDIQPQVKNIVKLIALDCSWHIGLIDNYRKKFTNDLIRLYYEEIISLFDGGSIDEESRDKLVLYLLEAINEFNRTIKRDRLDIREFPKLIEEIDRMMKLQKYNSENSCLCFALSRDPYLKDKYATNLLQASLLPNILEHLLKYKPDYIVNSMENILNDLFTIYGRSTFRKFITSRSRLDFLNITPQIEKLTCEKFKTSVSRKRKVNALKMYSYFANIEDFTDLVKEYIPSKERMHFDKDNGEFLEIQMTVPQLIKNIKPDSKNLPLISKYLNGDFLRWALTSFNSACHNSPITVILPLLMEYFPKQSISVKKVILQRIRDISVNNEKFKYFKSLWDTEKHSSVRSVIFGTISKCFVDNPTSEEFEVVKKFIMESDEVTIEHRPPLGSVPAQYLNEYTIQLWKFSEKYENSRFATNFRDFLIKLFTPANIWILSEEFCEMIIKNYLFVRNTNVYVDEFSCYYLVSNPYSMNQKLKLILKLMYERRENTDLITTFLNHLKSSVFKEPKRFVGVFDGLLEEWPKIYPGSKMFAKYLTMEYARGYVSSLKSSDFEFNSQFAVAFGKEIRSIITKVPHYDRLNEVFKITIAEFFRQLNSIHHITIINSFLGETFSQPEAVLAAIFIPQEDIRKNINMNGDGELIQKPNEEFKSLWNKLVNMNDDVVRLYLSLRLERVL